MDIIQAKTLIQTKFLTKTGQLNPTKTVSSVYHSLKSDFAQLLGCNEQLSVATMMYCIVNSICPKKCLHCATDLNVYRYSSGYNGKGSTYCSAACSSKHVHDKSGGILFTDYNSLLDKNGIPDSQKMDKNLNEISILHLKEISCLENANIKTMLYDVIHGKSGIRYCKECQNIIDVSGFSEDPYPKNKHFCSRPCRDKNADFKKNLKENNLARVTSLKYIQTVGLPWFSAKIKNILDKQNISTLATYEEIKASPRQSTYFMFKCNSCSYEFEARFIGVPVCRKCNPNSKPQQLLTDYIDSLGFKTIVNDRKLIKPHELDIIIPELKIAIEYDGLYWHRNRDHFHKYEKCAEIGYRLIKIFDDENEDIIRSRVAAILGKVENKIHARKCTISEIKDGEYSQFMEVNHIQGYSSALKMIGLYHENILVSVMSFSKPRFSKTCEWELIRFANKLNTLVVGGASKLFNYFNKIYKPESILSYCDLRWGTGKVYENLGFKFSHTTKKGYWYYKQKRESRLKYQKHKLSDLFENVDLTKSESEIMKDNGYSIIHDFGNSVYVWYKLNSPKGKLQ